MTSARGEMPKSQRELDEMLIAGSGGEEPQTGTRPVSPPLRGTAEREGPLRRQVAGACRQGSPGLGSALPVVPHRFDTNGSRLVRTDPFWLASGRRGYPFAGAARICFLVPNPPLQAARCWDLTSPGLEAHSLAHSPETRRAGSRRA